MNRLLSRWIPVALMVGLVGIARGGESDDAKFRQLADEFIDQYYFVFNPSIATQQGVHRFDDRLEDYSRAGVERNVRALQDYERRLVSIDSSLLSQQSAGDRDMLLSYVRSSLLTLQTVRPWQKNPDSYSSGISNSAYLIMEREYAPANERLRALIARERQMPAVLQAARRNLTNPPRIFTEIALEQLPGIESMFAIDVPAAFASADDPRLKAQFAEANARVLKSLADYEAWLKRDLLPRSMGDFRIGAKAFSDKLLYDEMVDTPLDRLLQIGIDDLHRNQAEFVRVGGQLAPGKGPREIAALLAADHPAVNALLAAVQADFAAQLQFIRDHRIISVPAEPVPKVIETPPFLRATTQASLDPPGAFETTAQSYFDVTLPDPSWSAARLDDYMSEFSYPYISNLSVHEAFPGHFFHFANLRHLDDRVRQIFTANTNVEGWAHYCEQMMLDEGFSMPVAGSTDARASQMLRLGQLGDALLRDARFIVGIRMHTGQMTFDQAVDFFTTEGYQPREIGLVEAKRGTGDPTYLYYTLGKLQILKLRADLQAREGHAFRLQDFHDRFMQQGAAPIRLVRRALLQDDSPTL